MRDLCCRDYLTTVGETLALGHAINRGSRNHLEALMIGVPDDEAARPSSRHRDLDADGERLSARRRNVGKLADGVAHRQCRGNGAKGGVRFVGPGLRAAVEPAGDGVARESRNAASEAVNFLDQEFEDAAQGVDEFFRASSGSEFFRKGRRQRCEAGEVREEACPQRRAR